MHDKIKVFPSIVEQHPEADLPINGVSTRLIQAGDQQFIFMEFSKDVEVPPHTHNAQWAVVLDGEIEMIIDGEEYVYRKGDSYFIEKDVLHSAKIKAGYKDLTLFDQKDRYQTKE
jgi:quercetin dioxygenase-like cupin family protein